jgi:hypothetical protein
MRSCQTIKRGLEKGDSSIVQRQINGVSQIISLDVCSKCQSNLTKVKMTSLTLISTFSFTFECLPLAFESSEATFAGKSWSRVHILRALTCHEHVCRRAKALSIIVTVTERRVISKRTVTTMFFRASTIIRTTGHKDYIWQAAAMRGGRRSTCSTCTVDSRNSVSSACLLAAVKR